MGYEAPEWYHYRHRCGLPGPRGPCYSRHVSKHLATSFLRFCLVGLLAVARLLCPCPTAGTANATELAPGSTHSCCGGPKAVTAASRPDADPSHQGGCKHCPDSPQVKPASIDDKSAAAVTAIEPSLPLTYTNFSWTVRFASTIRLINTGSAHPLSVLAVLRSVVLLI